MPPISAERCYAEIEASTETLAGLVDGADLTIPVPTCPEWTLRQLATHVGRAHRWAAEIASTRSAEFIPFRQVPDGRLPDDPAQQAPWLRAGAARVIDAVREAGSDRVWAFAGAAPGQLLGPPDGARDRGAPGRRRDRRRPRGRVRAGHGRRRASTSGSASCPARRPDDPDPRLAALPDGARAARPRDRRGPGTGPASGWCAATGSR